MWACLLCKSIRNAEFYLQPAEKRRLKIGLNVKFDILILKEKFVLNFF